MTETMGLVRAVAVRVPRHVWPKGEVVKTESSAVVSHLLGKAALAEKRGDTNAAEDLFLEAMSVEAAFAK